MAGIAKQSLEKWIQEARDDKDKDGEVSQFALVHVKGMRTEPVHSTRLGPDRQKWTNKELATLFQNKAETSVQDFAGSVQFFNLLVFYGDNPEPQAKRSIRVEVPSDFEGDQTENPTPVGQLRQTMRQQEDIYKLNIEHQKALMRQSIDMVNAIGQTFTEMSSALIHERQASQALAKENRDAFEIVKDIMMKKITEDREHEMKLAEYQRSTAMREKVMGMAPVLVNTLTGREVFPQSAADTVLIEQIAEMFDKMPEGQMEMMANFIPAQLMGPLMQRFTVWKAAQEEKAKRLAELNGRVRDPEAEAAGDVQPSVAMIVDGKGK